MEAAGVQRRCERLVKAKCVRDTGQGALYIILHVFPYVDKLNQVQTLDWEAAVSAECSSVIQ